MCARCRPSGLFCRETGPGVDGPDARIAAYCQKLAHFRPPHGFALRPSLACGLLCIRRERPPMSHSARSIRSATCADDPSDTTNPTQAQSSRPDAPSGHTRTLRSNRRAHRRLSPQELRRLEAVRVKYGPEVRVVDVSEGGILIETERALKPHSTIVFELTGAATETLIPARVLRSQMVSLEGAGRYRTACAFKRPLELSRLLSDPGLAMSAPAPAKPQTLAATTAAPTPVPTSAESWQKVIVRYRDGNLVRGFTCNFNAMRPHLHVSPEPSSRDSVIVPVNQLKAVFFVRDFAGDPDHIEENTFDDSTKGRKLEVTFDDGEILVGTTLSYRPDGQGFFVHPADTKGNNLRVFVSAGAVRSVRFLSR